jgi:hypothetical protein
MSFAAAVEHYGRAELLDGFRVWANDPGRNVPFHLAFTLRDLGERLHESTDLQSRVA